MKITKRKLQQIVREELIREGDVISMDFRSKRVRKNLTPQIDDPFIFSGGAGQIARVLEMQRDDSENDGGYVVYEQYVQRDGEWVQEPTQDLKKSLVGFSSRYTPYKSTIDHLNKRHDEDSADMVHIEREMAAAGFPDYTNARHDFRSKAYTDAMDKAMRTLPSMSF